jgi:hypothetical protein
MITTCNFSAMINLESGCSRVPLVYPEMGTVFEDQKRKWLMN